MPRHPSPGHRPCSRPIVDGPHAVPASLFRLQPAPVEGNPQETHDDGDLSELGPKDEPEAADEMQEASTALAKALALEFSPDFSAFEGDPPPEEVDEGAKE